MSLAAELKAFSARLNEAIHFVMETDVAEVTKKTIAEAVETEVYKPYDPVFYSRRNGIGGLKDPAAMSQNYDAATMTLEVSDTAPWQQLYGGRVPNGYLAEAVESGDPRYNMGAAGPRKFHAVSQEQMDNGEFEDTLLHGLQNMGFDVKKV